MNSATDPDIEALKTRFLETGFVHLARTTPMSSRELVDLAETFGDLLMTERHTKEHKAVQIISEEALFARDEVPWHNDWSYGTGNYVGTVLYNRRNAEIAPTYFVDMATACAALPYGERDRLRDVVGHYFPPVDLQSTCFTPRQLRVLNRARVSRPFVFDHPSTGRPVLYFSPGTLRNITNGEPDISSLTAHCEQFSWPHNWQPDDVLIYDNFRLMHRRPAFRGSRVLWRIQFAPSYPLSVTAQLAG
ncbi:MAG: TauD/TfdA dioxygenase family protein [Geminicoccaceae bacterium]